MIRRECENRKTDAEQNGGQQSKTAYLVAAVRFGERGDTAKTRERGSWIAARRAPSENRAGRASVAALGIGYVSWHLRCKAMNGCVSLLTKAAYSPKQAGGA